MEAGADLLADLGLHGLAHEPGHCLAQHVGVVIAEQLRTSSSSDVLFSGIVVLPLVVSVQPFRRL